MKHRAGLMLVLAAAMLSGAGLATASTLSTLQLQAHLTAAQQVPPQVVKTPHASARFSATLVRPSAGKGSFKWTLTYSGLSSPATTAYIFVPKNGKFGELVIQLCRHCKATTTGSATLTSTIATQLSAGASRAWVNLRTQKNPKGEIRGRVVVG